MGTSDLGEKQQDVARGASRDLLHVCLGMFAAGAMRTGWRQISVRRGSTVVRERGATPWNCKSCAGRLSSPLTMRQRAETLSYLRFVAAVDDVVQRVQS